jgi:hypothetical protein
MTFEERWRVDNPDKDFESMYIKMCPSQFGYEPVGSYCANPKDEDLAVICRACWQRETAPGKATEPPPMILCNSGQHGMPKKFEVIIRGSNGYFETGHYKTTDNANVLAASDLILEDLKERGYVRLWHDDGSCSVICSEAVLSFSVNQVKEEEK